MKELKDRERLPQGWKRVKLREVIIENIKSPFKVEDADNSGVYPFFTSGERVLTHSKFLVDGENLFVSTGGTAYVKYHKGKASYSTDTYSLKTKENTKLIYYILSKCINQITFRYFIGSGLEHLQKDDFKKSFQFSIPENPIEQQKIAEILETFDNAIEKTDKIIEKYKRIKQGLMQELLTKGIDEKGNIRSEKTHQFKDSPVGRIPVEWEVKRLGEIGEIVSG
ncbi:MAG: restriction endonuclease subunit S, partial [candidate division WOR-3 bacterium]